MSPRFRREASEAHVYQGCQCSNDTCLSGCESKIDSTCQSVYAPLDQCILQHCATPCGDVIDGG